MTDRVQTANKAPDIPDRTQLLSLIPSLPQRQDSLRDQLTDLRTIANRLGMYDAADAIAQVYGKVGDLRIGG